MRVTAPVAASVEIRPNGRHCCTGKASRFSSNRNGSLTDCRVTAKSGHPALRFDLTYHTAGRRLRRKIATFLR